MINNEFWQNAASAWSWEAKPDVKVLNGSGGEISQELLKNPYDVYGGADFIDFDKVDFDATVDSMLSGGDVVLKERSQETEDASKPEEPQKAKIILDNDKFYDYLEKESIDGYVACCQMLSTCGLSEDITSRYNEIIERLKVLKESDEKFKKVYEANLTMFTESYIPDALNVTVSYIEYENVGVGGDVLESTKKEVVDALDTLLVGINDKIDEIYKFASIELKAAAKALNATMEANGYVDSQYKIN